MAESCTGGLVAAALTEIAGSSDVFEAGFVTYSNEAKMDLLGVSEDVIETFGAVSVAVAWAMAQGALARIRRRRRGGDHRHRRARRRHRKQAGRHGRLRPRPSAAPIPSEIVADTKEFGDLGRGGVRLQAALCALELLLPGCAPSP